MLTLGVSLIRREVNTSKPGCSAVKQSDPLYQRGMKASATYGALKGFDGLWTSEAHRHYVRNIILGHWDFFLHPGNGKGIVEICNKYTLYK